MNYIETLCRVVREDKEREQLFLNGLRPDNIKDIAGGFSRNRQEYALESWLVQNDLEQTKQYLSDITVLYHFAIHPNLPADGKNRILPLMFCSDNTKAITAYCGLEQFRDYHNEESFSRYNTFVNAAVNAYLGNNELLEEDCFYLNKYWQSNFGMEYTINFYKALLQGDEEKIKENVELLGSEEYRQKMEIVTDLLPQYIVLPALNAAKLSWIKGYEIEFESKYIPKEWLPVQPNNEYTIPYEFVKEHCLQYNLV